MMSLKNRKINNDDLKQLFEFSPDPKERKDIANQCNAMIENMSSDEMKRMVIDDQDDIYIVGCACDQQHANLKYPVDQTSNCAIGNIE